MLSQLSDKEKVLLLDTPLSPVGLFRPVMYTYTLKHHSPVVVRYALLAVPNKKSLATGRHSLVAVSCEPHGRMVSIHTLPVGSQRNRAWLRTAVRLHS